MSSDTKPALPPELWTMIVRNITRPSDLCNLCLTSQDLYDIAAPFLYHCTILSTSKFAHRGVRRMYPAYHPGLKAIRRLEFIGSTTADKSLEMESAFYIILPLASGRLRSLRVRSPETLDSRTWSLIATHQRELTELDVTLSDLFFCLEVSPPNPGSWLSKLTTLSLRGIGSANAMIPAGNDVLEKAVNLHTLRLIGSENDSPRPVLNDVASELFPILDDGTEGHVPLSLRSLTLDGFSLSGAEQHVLRATMCTQLTSLTVERSVLLHDFFKHLGAWLIRGGSALRHIKVHARSSLSDSHLQKIFDVISIPTGVESIWVMTPRVNVLDIHLPLPSIAKHSRSLRSLTLSAHDKDDNGASIDTISAIAPELAAEFTSLEELAVNLPDLSMPLPLETAGIAGIECLRHIAKLPSLRTLKSYNWPVMPDSVHENMPDDLYGQPGVLQLMANSYLWWLDDYASGVLRIFHSLRTELDLPPLKAICFLESFFSPQSSDGTRRLRLSNTCYVPVMQHDANGVVELTAKRLPLRELKHIGSYYADRE